MNVSIIFVFPECPGRALLQQPDKWMDKGMKSTITTTVIIIDTI